MIVLGPQICVTLAGLSHWWQRACGIRVRGSEMVLVFVLILFGFVLGVAAVVAAEALGLLLIVKWLSTKIKQDEAKISLKPQADTVEPDPQQSLNFAENKQVILSDGRLCLSFLVVPCLYVNE